MTLNQSVMENKYFTPSIEDIRVGYTFEYGYKEWPEYQKVEILKRSDLNYWLTQLEEHPEKFRVPYLTKEQIEAEGWEPAREKPTYHFKKGRYHLEVSYRDGVEIHLGEGTYLFQGECKDINTFRYINKLLGIK